MIPNLIQSDVEELTEELRVARISLSPAGESSPKHAGGSSSTNSPSTDPEVKQLDDLKRQARVLRQQYASAVTSRPEVAEKVQGEVVKVRGRKEEEGLFTWQLRIGTVPEELQLTL